VETIPVGKNWFGKPVGYLSKRVDGEPVYLEAPTFCETCRPEEGLKNRLLREGLSDSEAEILIIEAIKRNPMILENIGRGIRI